MVRNLALSWGTPAYALAGAWGQKAVSQGPRSAVASAPAQPSTSSAAPQPAPQQQAPSQQQPPQQPPSTSSTNAASTGGHPPRPVPNIANINHTSCFVKNVQEMVTDEGLRRTLEENFGPIKELDIIRSKACAFLEFKSVESARRAIHHCAPHSVGGQGGIECDGMFIHIEVRSTLYYSQRSKVLMLSHRRRSLRAMRLDRLVV